ncbi:MAG: ComF family protein [Aggregatilineales bacterium]
MQNMISSEARSSRSGLLLYKSIGTAIGKTILDLVFPPRCAGCGRVDFRWCPACQSLLDTVPISMEVKQVAENFTVASTSIHDGKVQEAIHALKYDNVQELGFRLAERMIDVLKQQVWQIDSIVPVPLHVSRKLQRGYNQAQILGDFIGQACLIHCEPDAVIRQRATQSQVTLNREERLINMQDAFIANSDLISGKTILIVDDVLTTGSTLLAVSQAVVDAGAKMTYGLTITRAS